MVGKNNVIQSVHLRKHWNQTGSQKGHVKTYFDQAGRKLRRRILRAKKARRLFPRPADGNFRPVVHCATQRYNMKVRAGRGFSLPELRQAKITRIMAKQFNISVDYRRRTKRPENISRLKAYHARIVINPKVGTLRQVHGPVIRIPHQALRVRAIPLPKHVKKVKHLPNPPKVKKTDAPKNQPKADAKGADKKPETKKVAKK